MIDTLPTLATIEQEKMKKVVCFLFSLPVCSIYYVLSLSNAGHHTM